MNLFLINIRAFFIPLIVILFIEIGLLVVNYFIIQSHPFKIPKNKNTLIIGDSNTACAINDSIYTNAFNISDLGAPYYYCYLSLNKILKTTTHIDTVIVSFSPHNIVNNDRLLNPSYIQSQMGIFYPLMSSEDFLYLYNEKSDAVFHSLPSLIKQASVNCFYKISNTEIKYPGKFLSLDRNDLKKVIQKLVSEKKSDFFEIAEEINYSQHEIFYLKKIIKLCQQHNIKIYLINTPKRQELLKLPIYRVAEFNQFYSKNFNKIPFWDYSTLLLPDDCYGDLVHLNKKGAAYFTKKMLANRAVHNQ